MVSKSKPKEKRKFGNKTYTFIHTRRKKSAAEKDAKGIRERKGLARVVPLEDGYAVYGRRSR